MLFKISVRSPFTLAVLWEIRNRYGPLKGLVARGGLIREANQDGEAARRVRIGQSQSESMDAQRSPFEFTPFRVRTAYICRRRAARLKNRHADFHNAKQFLPFLSLSQVPGRSLLKTYIVYDDAQLSHANFMRSKSHLIGGRPGENLVILWLNRKPEMRLRGAELLDSCR